LEVSGHAVKKGLATALTYLTGLALIAVPVMLSMFVANRQSLHIESKKASVLADEVMRRAEETGQQGRAAIKLLNANRAGAACSPEEIALMGQLALSSSYLQSVGRIQGNRLICSSLGDHGAGFDVGPPDYVSSRGIAVRVAVTLPLAPKSRFVISEDHGYAAIVHRDLIFDVQDYANEISLGLISASTQRVIATRGTYNPSWLGPLAEGAAKTRIDGDFIIAQRRSKTLDLISVAAIPVASANHLARELIVFLVPFGLLGGLALATVFYFVVRRQISVPALLRAGLRRDEFSLVYQPIVRLDTRQCVGAEALLRWRRRDGTLIRPDLFIPIAEESGIITSITRRILDLIEREAPEFIMAFPRLYVSINLSSRDLQSRDIVKRFNDLMHRSGIKPENLTVEATERGLIDVALATPIVHDIRAAGIRVAIDDFGTGYSSLSYLTQLQVDFLKIDKSFIDTIGTTAPTNTVVLHIIEMAKSLNLAMIAEGVETDAQAQFLRDRGVQFAQGFLYATPMSLEDLVLYVQAEASEQLPMTV
jgi:Predicted signal transduction protein containing sensor and EAL domains